MTGTVRLVEVPPERLAGWVERFAASHGGVVLTPGADAVVLAGADGTRASLEVPWPPLLPPDGEAPAGADGAVPGGEVVGGEVAALAAHAARPRTALLLLVRRGGVAVGLARDGVLLDHTSASGYVQGRTAAGGWSQQRYARRRAGQAAALGGSTVDAVLRLLARGAGEPEVLVPGGDRPLVAAVLDDPRLAAVAGLPRGPLLDVPDPRLAVLQDAAQRARAVRVRVTDA